MSKSFFLKLKAKQKPEREDTIAASLPVWAIAFIFSMDDTFFKTRPDQETKPDSKDTEDGPQSDQGASGSTSHCSTPSNSTCDKPSVDMIPVRKGGPLIDISNPDRPVLDNMAAQGFFCVS